MNEDQMTFSEEVIERLVKIETLLTTHLEDHKDKRGVKNGIIIGCSVGAFTTLLAILFL